MLVYCSRAFDKKPNPVSMSKLLSFGYVEEEKATPERKLSSEYFRWGSPLSIVHYRSVVNYQSRLVRYCHSLKSIIIRIDGLMRK